MLLRLACHCAVPREGLEALSAYWPAHAFENRNLLGCITLLIHAQYSSLPESTEPGLLPEYLVVVPGAWLVD